MVCAVKSPTPAFATSIGDREKGKMPMTRTEKAYIRWNMVFTWQAPMMLLAYSVIAFLMGVTVYITTPLYTDDRSLGGKSVSIPAEGENIRC